MWIACSLPVLSAVLTENAAEDGGLSDLVNDLTMLVLRRV